MNHYNEESQKVTKYTNFWKAQQLALGFLVLFIAQASALNLQAKVMNQNGFGPLGNYNLAALSIFCVVGGFLSTTIIKKFGINISLVISAIGIAQWILCSVLPALKNNESDPQKKANYIIYQDGFIYSILIISSCICGFTTGVLWTAQGVYTAECATEDSKGFYFSCFWTTYTFSQVVGNLIAAFILGSMEQSSYFFIMTGVAASSTIVFATLRKPQKSHNFAQNQKVTSALDRDSSQENNSLIITSNNSAQNQALQQQQQSAWENIKAIWNCFIQKRMLLFLPENGWTGISISYYMDHNDQSQFKKAMLAMVAFGVGEMIGGQIIGQVVDKVSSKAACVVNLGIMIVMMAFTFAFLGVYEYGWLPFLMCFFWGLQDSSVNTHVFEMLGFEFDNSDDAFAIYSLMQSIISFVFQFSQAWVDTKDKYWIYTIIVGVLGIICVSITYFFDFKPSHNSKKH
eukprot:403336943